MKRDAAVGELACLRLADVVEQRGEPGDAIRRALRHHRDGVGEHVLVAMQWILLQPESGELREEHVGESAANDPLQTGLDMVADDEPIHLVANPLGAHDEQPLPHLFGSRLRDPIRGEPERGCESIQTQHPQRVVGERDVRIERGLQDAGPEIDEAPMRVDHLGFRKQPQRHRVDREVAA